MSTAVNSTADQLHSALFTLESAGVGLADDVEVDDIDDAVSDHPVVFPTRPFAVLAQVAGLSDTDEALFALARPGSLETRAVRALSLIHISEPTRHFKRSRMPSSA